MNLPHYPGCTREFCVPLLEKGSNLKFNEDFFCGYSPERINPGDKEHRLPDIKKVTSGSTPEIATTIDELYKNIISTGTHKSKAQLELLKQQKLLKIPKKRY